MGRLGTAARSAGRIGRDSDDVTRAEDSLEVLRHRQTELQNEFDSEIDKLKADFDPAAVTIERVTVKPRKSDIDVKEIALLWLAV